MQSEFDCGGRLLGSAIAEEDIENLIIQQIEFCNIVLLNKRSEVAPAELERLRQIVHNLNPGARIIEADYAELSGKVGERGVYRRIAENMIGRIVRN